jgi:hypothetical protein
MSSAASEHSIRIGSAATHEDFARGAEIKLSSDRTFGLVWTAFLILYGLAPLRHARAIRPWPLAIACGLLFVSVFCSSLLHRPNLLWAKVGLLLNRIVNPIVMGLMFYGCFVPVALVHRIRKKDPLRLARDRDADTYWIDRERPGSDSSSMTHQY